jgi:MinD superfamily P-loop ATPase
VTLRVATVLSAREWEGELVALAHQTAAVRLVLRAYQPADIEEADGLDLVVAGAETSWVTPSRVATWRRKGLRVVGIYPSGDRPARQLLETGGADEVYPDDTPIPVLLQALRLLRPAFPVGRPEPIGRMVAVTGPRGAPGRTEVAVGLAWTWAATRRTLLIDLDQTAPAVAVRLGLPPRPDLADAADGVRTRGFLTRDSVQHLDSLAAVVGSHRPGESLVTDTLAEEVVEAALASFELLVADLGPADPGHGLIKRADHAVLVAEASAVGLVRVAQTVSEWAGPPPTLILNRVGAGQLDDVLAAARRWTGLEPAAVIPDRPAIRDASRRAIAPERVLCRALGRLETPV